MIYLNIPYKQFHTQFIQNHNREEAILEICLNFIKSNNATVYDTVLVLDTKKHENGLTITCVTIDICTKYYINLIRDILNESNYISIVKSDICEIELSNVKYSENCTYKYCETKTLYELFIDKELPQYIINSCKKQNIQFWVYPIPPKNTNVNNSPRYKYVRGTRRRINMSNILFKNIQKTDRPFFLQSQ